LGCASALPHSFEGYGPDHVAARRGAVLRRKAYRYAGLAAASLLLVAIGIGLAFVPATICAVAGVARSEAGLASGLVNTSRLFGGALGLAILAAIATAHTNSVVHNGATNMHAALTSGFDLAFIVAAGFALVGGFVALFGLPGVPRPARSERAEAPAVEHAAAERAAA